MSLIENGEGGSEESSSSSQRWSFWRKETIVVAIVSVLASVALTYWTVRVSKDSMRVSKDGVQVSQGSRMDGFGERLDAFGTRLDTFGTRVDGGDKKTTDLTNELAKIRRHEKAMWVLANEICQHLAEEERRGVAKTGPPKYIAGPPKYIAGAPPPPPARGGEPPPPAWLCSLIPDDPDKL